MSGQQKSPHEEFILTVIVAGLIFGISYVIWKTFRVELTEVLRWIRVGELYIANLLAPDNYYVRDAMGNRNTIPQWIKWLPTYKAADISNESIKTMTHLAVPPLKMLFVVLIGLMTMWTIFFGPGTHYKRRMRLEELMREQARSFPAIQPFLKFDPRKLPFRAPGQPVPAQLPLFSEALSPEEWLAYNEISLVGGQLDANRAWDALTKQLGKRWQGPLKMPLHSQALYAVCALKHARKRKDSEMLLNALSTSWTPEGGLKLSGKIKKQIRDAIKNPKIGGAIEKYADKHAYETTALLRCLTRARQEGGVLAPAEFLWLRGHDRNLWYPMNNLGRKSYHAEAAGAMVHYTNELIADQKIPTPRFEEVIRGIETYMKSGAARSIPDLDKEAGNAKYWKK